MLKKFKNVLAFALALSLIPLSGINVAAEEGSVKPTTEYVSTEVELLDAIKEKKSHITLTADITIDKGSRTGKGYEFLHEVEIDGNGKTVSAVHTDEWQGLYVFQFYNTKAILNNITLTGGDAGLLVNGANVTLKGNINVSGNEYGGIEVARGTDLTGETKLDVTGANLLNSTETKTKPTIWLDKLETGVDFKPNQLTEVVQTDDENIGKTYYFIKEVTTPEPEVATEVSDEAGLIAAVDVNSTVSKIKLTDDIKITQKIDISKDIEIDGAGKTITANGTEDWESLYVLHFYKVNATLKNITLTGGDAAILVNGSNLTLEGDIDVSGNEFGGIEVSRGSGVVEESTLTITDANLINTTDDLGKPTVWVVGEEGTVVGAEKLFEKVSSTPNQIHYSVYEVTATEVKANTLVSEMMKSLETSTLKVELDAVNSTVKVTKLGSEITVDEVVDFLTSLIYDNEAIETYHLSHEETGNLLLGLKSSKEDVKETVTGFLSKITAKAPTTRAIVPVVDLEALLATEFKLGFTVDVDGVSVRTNDFKVAFGQDLKTPPTVVDPGEEDNKDKNNDKPKNPNTGLESLYPFYVTIVALGAVLLVVLKSRKKYN